jgi:hypothetical protein
MFEELIEKASVKISTVRAIIKTNHRLRSIVFRDSLNKQKLEENPEFTALTIGESIFLVLVNDQLSYCYSAKIESIQLNDISQNLVEITSEAEVGLKFDMNARKGLTIYVTK